MNSDESVVDSGDSIEETTAVTVAFERDLESLVLSAFADGAAVEGSWEFELPVADAPDWTVEIRKRRAETETGDAPELLD